MFTVLFMFVVDGLSALLKNDEVQGKFTPLEVCCRAPGISHLLFVVDTLLLFKADKEQAREVRKLINTYETAT